MPRGTDSHQKDEEERAASRSNVWHIKLKDDGESCRLRFLTEYDDLFWSYFHRLMQAGSFAGLALCVQAEYGEPCEYCAQGNKATKQFLAWAYEIHHDFTVPTKDAEQVKVGMATRYRLQVNKPRVFRYATTHMAGLKLRIERYGTLLDRDYDWSRIGPAGSMRPSYVLEPFDPSPASKEILDLIPGLMDLEDVAKNKPDGQQGASKEATAEKAGSYHTVPVEENEEDDGFNLDNAPF